jgi:hypothetical protein
MRRTSAFTLLEIAIIVAIIGMMLMMIVGYLLAPKDKGALPPVPGTTPIPSSPASATTLPQAFTAPTATPPAVTPAPATPAPATPVPTATPTHTIDLSPQSPPIFR